MSKVNERIVTFILREGPSTHLTMKTSLKEAENVIEQWENPHKVVNGIKPWAIFVKGVDGEYMSVHRESVSGLLVVDPERAIKETPESTGGRKPEVHGKLH